LNGRFRARVFNPQLGARRRSAAAIKPAFGERNWLCLVSNLFLLLPGRWGRAHASGGVRARAHVTSGGESGAAKGATAQGVKLAAGCESCAAGGSSSRTDWLGLSNFVFCFASSASLCAAGGLLAALECRSAEQTISLPFKWSRPNRAGRAEGDRVAAAAAQCLSICAIFAAALALSSRRPSGRAPFIARRELEWED